MGPALGASPARYIAVACCVLQWPLLGHPINAYLTALMGLGHLLGGGGRLLTHCLLAPAVGAHWAAVNTPLPCQVWVCIWNLYLLSPALLTVRIALSLSDGAGKRGVKAGVAQLTVHMASPPH